MNLHRNHHQQGLAPVAPMGQAVVLCAGAAAARWGKEQQGQEQKVHGKAAVSVGRSGASKR